ncbi:MAG: hypothetical protein AB7F86_08320 [Bdellovibrionales bacterium]
MDRLFVLGVAIVIGGAATALPVKNGDFSCTPQTQAERYIHDLSINVDSFGGPELCDSKVDTKKLLNDLELIEEGRFSEVGDNAFIQDFVPASQYLPWLIQQTRGIERGNDLPWATAYNSWGYFTMQDGWAKLSTLGRVGTLLHEARHTEGYSHTICQHGPYKDTSVAGCDESLSAGGSHAVEMEYYARVVLQGENFHPVYQSMARLMLFARSNFVFNENPLEERATLLVRATDGLLRLDGVAKKVLNWSWPGSELFRLKRTSFGATLVDLPNGAWALDLHRPDLSIGLTDDYSYFKILKLNPPANLVDMEEVDIGLTRYLYALNSHGDLYTYIFGQGDWSSPRKMPGASRLMTTSPMGETGIFVLFDNQTYCPINKNNLRCEQAPKPWPELAHKFVRYQEMTLQLNEDGLVYDSQGETWPDLRDQEVLDMEVVPHYDVLD